MKKPSSHLRDFTRGGQIFNHSLHMFWQVLRLGLILALLVFLAALSGLVYKDLTPYDRYIFWESIDAEIKLLIYDNRVKVRVLNPNNSVIELKAVDFIRSPKTQVHLNKCYQVFWASLKLSGLLSLLLFLLYCLYLKIKGRRANQDTPLQGQEQINPKALSQLLKTQGQASDFQLAGVPLLKDSETQHLLLTGTTGTGKSVAMLELMDQVRQKGQRAIVYDIDGSFVPLYYRPDKDILLNPLDTRVPAWTLWQECRDLADFKTVALSFMPDHLIGNDPFWIQSARNVFAYTALRLSQSKPKTQNLLEPIFGEGLKPLVDLLAGTPAAPLMVETIDKTALSIKGTLANHCEPLLYLKDEGTEPLFSIRRWIEADKGDSWLFLASNAQKIDALKPILSVWLDIAAKAILSLEPSDTRQLWFFLDELASLHQLPSLMNVLSRGRKFGACFVASIQDIHQIHAIYGRNQAESLISLFNTKLLYRSQEPDSAAWMSKVVGNREHIEKKEGFSYGAHAMRDGVSIHPERRQEPVLSPSSFLELPDLSAFLKLPGEWPVTQVRFEPIDREELSPAFIPRVLNPLPFKIPTAPSPAAKPPQPKAKPKLSKYKKLRPLRDLDA